MLDAFFQRFILTLAYLLANFDGLLLRWTKEMLNTRSEAVWIQKISATRRQMFYVFTILIPLSNCH